MANLDSLRRSVALARGGVPMVRVSGVVSEIAPALFRVSGLSRFVNLGETVTLHCEAGPQVGEIIRIDDSGIVVKPFESNVSGGIGMQAFNTGVMLLFPHASWKGRVIRMPRSTCGMKPCGVRRNSLRPKPMIAA